MNYETITLHPYEDATLTAICLSNFSDLKQAKRKAVIVCPGGGYTFLSEREAEPVATALLGQGFAAFILRYSVGEKAKDGAPLAEMALAMKYVRENAEKYNVDPDYVFTLGFSAGGHLAGSIGILSHHPVIQKVLGDADPKLVRPTGMVLCYPVVTGCAAYTHRQSIENLCGHRNPTEEERNVWSLEKHVNEDAPEAFIWQTFNDDIVPVENSLMLAEAYVKAKVKCEYHLFPEGPHGASLANEQTCSGQAHYLVPAIQCWLPLAVRFMQDCQKDK